MHHIKRRDVLKLPSELTPTVMSPLPYGFSNTGQLSLAKFSWSQQVATAKSHQITSAYYDSVGSEGKSQPGIPLTFYHRKERSVEDKAKGEDTSRRDGTKESKIIYLKWKSVLIQFNQTLQSKFLSLLNKATSIILRVKGYSHDKALKIITESLFESPGICMRAIHHIIQIIRNEDVHSKTKKQNHYVHYMWILLSFKSIPGQRNTLLDPSLRSAAFKATPYIFPQLLSHKCLLSQHHILSPVVFSFS